MRDVGRRRSDRQAEATNLALDLRGARNARQVHAARGRDELDAGDETVWLTQRQMADLFETSTDNVGLHIKNTYDEGELEAGATTEESLTVRSEGGRQVRRRVQHYNLDVIISVGYRAGSRLAHMRSLNAVSACSRDTLRSSAPE